MASSPLTKIALALMHWAALRRLVVGVVLMGAAYGEAGNVTPAAELIVWRDAEAARFVFAPSPAKVRRRSSPSAST